MKALQCNNFHKDYVDTNANSASFPTLSTVPAKLLGGHRGAHTLVSFAEFCSTAEL